MITKEQIYQLKIDALNGELENENTELFEYLIQDPDYFSDDFIQYVLNQESSPWNRWDDEIVNKIGIDKIIISKQGESRENLIQALSRNDINVKKIVSNLENDSKKEINELINTMAEDGKFQIDKIHNLMDKESFNKYYEKNEEKFSTVLIKELLDEGIIENISDRAKEILLNNSSYETCEKYYKNGKIDIDSLDEKKSILEDEKKKIEKNNRISSAIANINCGLDVNKDVLIRDLSAAQFYDLYKNKKINDEVLKDRKDFDQNILDNAEKYDKKTVSEAITGQYFQKGLYNTCLDLETIVNYNKSKKINDDNSKKIEEIYNYLQSNDEHNDKIDIKKIEQIAKNINIDETINNEIKQFGNELNNELKMMQNNISKIKKEYVQNTNVPIYRLENKSENEKNLKLLVHSELVENAKKYYEKKWDGISFSLLDNNHLDTFLSGIIFGYNSIDSQNIKAVNTEDGQTNQINIFSDENRRVKANDLYSVEEYLKNTDAYNEIAVKTKDERPKPDYILTYEKYPNNNEIEIAQMYNIPIISVDKSKYIDKNLDEKDNKSTYKNRFYTNEFGRDIKLKDRLKSSENEKIDKNHIKKFAKDKDVILEKKNAKEMIEKLNIEQDIEIENFRKRER